MSGAVLLSLSNPAAFTSIFRVDIKAALKSTGLSNDTVSIYGQVFASDLITPLTGEVLLATRTSNTTATVTVTAQMCIRDRPRTTLSVSNMSGLRWTPAARFAQTIRSVIQSQRRASSSCLLYTSRCV